MVVWLPATPEVASSRLSVDGLGKEWPIPVFDFAEVSSWSCGPSIGGDVWTSDLFSGAGGAPALPASTAVAAPETTRKQMAVQIQPIMWPGSGNRP
ncbi:MAG: hypothetical protein ACK5KM_05735, partial [Hyphomicrobiaceae bacterium]